MAPSEKKAASVTSAVARPSDQDISDAYLYLLGRLLVLRQEHLDFKNAGLKWNEVVHRDVGGVAWANPNLDVAYSESWIAVDDHSCTLIDVPDIVGRYYTIQILNPWGETITNINERNYPTHPAGAFLICMKGARVALPTGTQRIDLPGRKARVLTRIALGADREEAAALQHQFVLRPTGIPRIAAPIDIPLFTNEKLPGVEAFDTALAVLASEPDSNPGTSTVQAKVRAVAADVAERTAERSRVDDVIRREALPALEKEAAALGVVGNGWVHPKVAGNFGDDWLGRTAANLLGIWSNSKAEVVYFGMGTATPLNGSDTRTMTFRKGDLPASHVKYFWSVTCADAVSLRVIPNPKNRFLLNKQSRLEFAADGSLTLYFAPQKPTDAPDGNWLPTPADQNYVLTWRSYGPDSATVAGKWFPPPLVKK